MIKNVDIDNFQEEVKTKWNGTKPYQEYLNNKDKINDDTHKGLMNIFKQIGTYLELDYSHELVQTQIKRLQDYISSNYYTCTNEILNNLGKMYVSDERFKNNIDKISGKGTAEFTNKAIEYYCCRK